MSHDKLLAVLTGLLVQKGVAPAEVLAALTQSDGVDFLDTVILPTLTVEELKLLWDNWSGVGSICGYSGEAIHAELNRRGAGNLCPV